MLLRNRSPRIDARPPVTSKGFEHLSPSAISVVRWLNANRIDYVLVGPVARSIRGASGTAGPPAIVPAPYRRNLDRLARALNAAHARIRVDGDPQGPGQAETQPVKITLKLLTDQRLTLRCGEHDVDVEGRSEATPRYQELLYEAGRFEVADEVSVEVAAPEDIEHYDHVRRTGRAPELRVTRAVRDPEVSDQDL